MQNKIITFTICLLMTLTYTANSQTVYFSEDFESQSMCAPTGNGNSCTNGNGSCPLTGNIVNPSTGDDVDWRIINGTTVVYAASFPLITFDHTTGTSSGQYAYISETDDCFEEVGHLEIQNLDLTNATNPVLKFWYHKYDQFINGTPNYGSLNVDILSNGTWTNGITPTISGNYGNQWNEVQVSLASYTGGIVKIRFRGKSGDFTFVTIGLDDITVVETSTVPSANFNISSPSCQSSTTFTDNSTNLPTSWSWDFGTNATPQTATGQGPHTVSYSSTANQTVTLITSNGNGSDTVTQSFQPMSMPTPDYSWITSNKTVVFSNTTANATTHLWDFGDGNSSTQASPSHTYTNYGTYTVTLQSINGCGNNSITKTVNVVVSSPPVPSMTVASPACYNSVTFTDNSTNAPASWNWDFGINATPQTATGPGPHTVTFTDASTQSVSLTATNSAGSATTTQNVPLDTLPISSFSWIANNEEITFTNTSINGNSYLWVFGDGTTSTDMNPGEHIYTTSGVYTVTLQVTNDCGTTVYAENVEVIVTHIEEIETAWDIQVLPNPNNGRFALSLKGVNGDVNIEVLDISGRQLKQWHFSNVTDNWNENIDISSFSSGVYFLRVLNENGVKVLKLVID